MMCTALVPKQITVYFTLQALCSRMYQVGYWMRNYGLSEESAEFVVDTMAMNRSREGWRVTTSTLHGGDDR